MRDRVQRRFIVAAQISEEMVRLQKRWATLLKRKSRLMRMTRWRK